MKTGRRSDAQVLRTPVFQRLLQPAKAVACGGRSAWSTLACTCGDWGGLQEVGTKSSSGAVGQPAKGVRDPRAKVLRGRPNRGGPLPSIAPRASVDPNPSFSLRAFSGNPETLIVS